MGYFSCHSCGLASYSQAPEPTCPECGGELSGGDSEERLTPAGAAVRLRGGPLAPSEAREMIDGWRTEIDEPLLTTVKLLVSELVTNRVALAGCSSVGLVLALSDERIRVTVSDHGHPEEPPDGNGANRSADWGLHLVEGLADRWDVEDGEEPRVWFEIARRH